MFQDRDNLGIHGGTPYPPPKSTLKSTRKSPPRPRHTQSVAPQDGYPVEDNSMDITDDISGDILPTLEERMRREASLLSDQYSGDG